MRMLLRTLREVAKIIAAIVLLLFVLFLGFVMLPAVLVELARELPR